MNLDGRAMGIAAFTEARASLAEAGALAAAVLTLASADGPAAIRAARSLAREASAAARSITLSPSARPRAELPAFSNIISFMGRLLSPAFGFTSLGWRSASLWRS